LHFFAFVSDVMVLSPMLRIGQNHYLVSKTDTPTCEKMTRI
jgi:hypothetical protein